MRKATNRLPALPTTVAVDSMFSEQDILHLAAEMPCYTDFGSNCTAYWECSEIVAWCSQTGGPVLGPTWRFTVVHSKNCGRGKK
jgi:hypothetical protein